MHKLYYLLSIALSLYAAAAYTYLYFISKKYLLLRGQSANSLLNESRNLPSRQEIRSRFKDKETINLLVLTGGGVRGLIPLRVLSELERLTGKKSGELFDFMAGSSTGAINCGIMSVPDANGGFRYSASQIAQDYYANIRKMFSAPFYHTLLTLFGLLGPCYLPRGKIEVLSSYFGGTSLADLSNNLLVPVYDIAENSLRVIRSWEHASTSSALNYSLLDLIHGASNLPLIFAPRTFTIASRKKIFIDPGMIINNPAGIALLNLSVLFPNKQIRLVLIGNGGHDRGHFHHQHMTEFGAYGLLQYLVNSPIISSKFTTESVYEYIADSGLDVDFVFLNSGGGRALAAGDVSKKNMQLIENYAQQLIAENRDKISQLATVLMQNN